MKEVHFIAQGKGGVGKSLVAAWLAQYLQSRSPETLSCFDTDPVNPTFSRYQALKPAIVNILTENNNIDARRFDNLMEQLIEGAGIAVVDNGAATFVPLMSYLAENQVPDLLREAGVRLIVHVPLNGGQALTDCLTGLAQTLRSINAEVVVWLNEYKGRIEEGGKDFADFKLYKDNRSRIIGLVRIENRNPDTFGVDIARMTEQNLTFAQADSPEYFPIMPRSRLKRVKDDLFMQLDALPFLHTVGAAEHEAA